MELFRSVFWRHVGIVPGEVFLNPFDLISLFVPWVTVLYNRLNAFYRRCGMGDTKRNQAMTSISLQEAPHLMEIVKPVVDP